jgi:hypothetical protein
MDDLYDIVIPDPVSLWPPGPAWFVLAGLILVGIACVVWLRYRRWQRDAYRRTALEQLDTTHTIPEISLLLKRVALVSYDRREVAGLAGTDWIEFLRNTGGRFADDDGRLLAAAYRNPATDRGANTVSPPPLDSLVSSARAWIRNHHV